VTAVQLVFDFSVEAGGRRRCHRCNIALRPDAVKRGVRECGFCIEELERGLEVGGGARPNPEAIRALVDSLVGELREPGFDHEVEAA